MLLPRSVDADKLRYALEQVLGTTEEAIDMLEGLEADGLCYLPPAGKASSFKFNVSHVLMMAVVIVLVAIYEAIQRNNELQEQQLRLRQKSKRA